MISPYNATSQQEMRETLYKLLGNELSNFNLDTIDI